MTATKPVTPQGIRAALRAAGMVTVHERSREGIRVPNVNGRSWDVPSVTIDLDRPSEARVLREVVTAALVARGWTVTPSVHTADILYITAKG